MLQDTSIQTPKAVCIHAKIHFVKSFFSRKKLHTALGGLSLFTAITTGAFAQFPQQMPQNLPQNIPPGMMQGMGGGQMPVGIPQGANANISTGTIQQRDETTARQYVTDQRQKAREDSIRLLRGKAEDVASVEARLKIFGAEIFNNKAVDMSPNLNVSVPRDYVLGTNDVLLINLFGQNMQGFVIEKRVTAEGNVQLDRIGPVQVGGMTIEAATQLLRQKLSSIYPIGRGMEMNLRLGDIRSIRVNFVGEVVNPGTYTLPSLATVMNALYFSGGPTAAGSFREIKLNRRSSKTGRDTTVAVVDLYHYLTTGLRNGDISLRDDDVIQISPYKTRIELAAGVKKPGLFEVKPGEKLGDLIKYAGGLVEDAYQANIVVQRLTENGRKFLDVKRAEIDTFRLQNGDRVGIGKIPEREENMVVISGPVYLPGSYPLDRNPTVKTLIARAEGMKRNAFLGRARIVRIKDDLLQEIIPINITRIQAGQDPDVPLKALDHVEIVTVDQLREGKTVRIQGEVNNVNNEQGYYSWYDGMTVEDLIIMAGNLEPSASPSRIEVVRPKRLASDDPSLITDQLAETFTLSIDPNLRVSSEASTFKLQPFDEVFVRSSPNFENNQTASVEGQVIYPGIFGLVSRDERISDLIKRAGGLNKYAFVDGATLVRKVQMTKTELALQDKTVQQLSDDTKKAKVDIEPVFQGKEDFIGIDLAKIMDNPHSEIDLILQNGDVINIPKYEPTIRIDGQVQLPTTAKYSKGASLGEYISRAGGFTAFAKKRATYVVYKNGQAKRSRRFLFFNTYPEIRPGARIVVPTKTQADITTQQIISTIGQIGGTLSGIIGILALVRTFQN